MSKNNWSRDQTIVALASYCKIPFNLVSSKHPEVIKISQIIGRSPNAVKMKIGNFGSFDPELRSRGIVGLANTSELDEVIWNEYSKDWERLAYESEMLKAKFLNQTLEDFVGIKETDFPEGLDRMAMAKQRVNQSFFRSAVLASYNQKCCITGLNIPELLVASHIVPWSIDRQNRTNPCNGLCLNALHDRAFDAGLISVSMDYRLLISQRLIDFIDNSEGEATFLKMEGHELILPDRFLPDPQLLSYHRTNIFKR